MTYIFDFDGTLVDSMPIFVNTILRIFEENNIAYPDDIVKIITPLGYKGTAEYAVSMGLKMSVAEFISSATRYVEYEYHNNIDAKDFVKEKLTQLKEQGYSLNVLTASPHFVLDVCLKRLGLYQLFDNVWSSEDFHRTKADPQIYRDVAKKLNTATNECCFVDDNVNAIMTAKQAGMNTIGVFDKSSEDFVYEMRCASDRYIMNFDEL